MYILASQSPRRKQLFGEDISKDFQIIVSNTDEHFPTNLTNPKDIVRYIGRQKGEVIHEKYPGFTVISADTIVVLDNEIIGKPKDAEDAKKMLRKLSNRTHTVYTGYAIFKDDKVITNVIASYVVFNKLTDEFIEEYVATGSPLDKAGAYGVQDNEKYPTVKEIIGSVKNVIGFPTDEIKVSLKEIEE